MKKRHAFTLVELLVVIAIIAVLLAILMPSLGRIKAAGQRLQCANKLGGIGKAFSMYATAYDDALPTLEFHKPSSGWNQLRFIASIETMALVNKRSQGESNLTWRHMGCLYGSGHIDTGLAFYCPAVEGWREDYKNQLQSGSDGQTSWANITNTSVNQGNRSRKGYIFWPLAKEYATRTMIDNYMGSNSKRALRYVAGMPINATRLKDVLMTRPIGTDNQFHSVKGSGWMLNTLYADGHVMLQPQPKREGLGMYNNEENIQFTEDVYKNGAFIDREEAARNLPSPVSPTEFAFALQP